MNPKTLLLSFAVAATTVLSAQDLPLGGEFEVNSYTTGSHYQPAVASAPDGSFVVVWRSPDEGSVGSGIIGQRFSNTGERLGAEFLVNGSTTTLEALAPAITAGSNGSYVVVWTGTDGTDTQVLGQRLGMLPGPIPKFGKIGSEFPINTHTTGLRFNPSVAEDRSGNFVVAWTDGSFHGGSASYILGQRFAANGARVGSEFQINTSTTGLRDSSGVGYDDGGNFVVAWQGPVLGTGAILARRFDSSGTAIGNEFLASSSAAQNPSIAVDGSGAFVVAYGANTPADYRGISGQRFDPDGNPNGAEFHINSYTTDIQDNPSVAMNPDGNFLVIWSSDGQEGPLTQLVYGQRFDRSGARIGDEFLVSTDTSHFTNSPRAAIGGDGAIVTWTRATTGPSPYDVFARRVDRVPVALSVDGRAAEGGSSDADGVLEPGEIVLVAPEWLNASPSTFGDFTGAAESFTGPGAVQTLVDSSADYGALPEGAVGTCDDGSSGACYLVSASGQRPGAHWDARLVENVTGGGGHAWTIHVGDSFSDVPRNEPFYKKIETILHHGITTGCDVAIYCPAVTVTRDAMAIFVAKGIAGSADRIPPDGTVDGQAYHCGIGGNTLFTDVAPTDSFCKHVHYLAAQNVTLGCDATHYCPSQNITRDAMASFIAKAIVAPGGGAAVPVSYTDATTARTYSCVSGSPNLHFTDVAVSNPFCKHIHFLWAKGIVDGCAATKYCPGSPVARDAMAKFIANAFNLQLYEP
ncbi:MAG TPA: hypothetical protein VH482_33725 [Thermomicrobiales bacterium]|jgi:hypothetical protein